MIIIPVVTVVGTVVTVLTVLTVGVVAVVGDSVVNVVGLLVLSTTHTHRQIHTFADKFHQTRYKANQKKHFVKLWTKRLSTAHFKGHIF